jgi:hypothetical protein
MPIKNDTPNLGVKSKYWFWGADHSGFMPNKEDEEGDAIAQADIPMNPKAENKNPDTEILELIAQNPDINASTFYNLLKSKGFAIIGLMDEPSTTPVDEADSSGANSQVLRSDVNKESSKARFKGNVDFKCQFVESAAKDNGIGYTKYSVVLIKEGMGNLKDAFYYHRDALMSAVPVFEGKKIYADHPTLVEEQIRPERSVRDVLGHFENVRLEETDGQAMLCADVVTMPDEPYRWARALMRHAVEYSSKYPDKEFVGLSINASGDASPMSIDKLIENGVPESAKLKLLKAQAEGIETIKLVTRLDAAVSCDLVTEAGAGGMILEMIEGEKSMGKKIKLHEAEEVPEKKPVEKKEGEEALPPTKDGEKPEAPHADEQADLELIKKLLADYGITDAEESEIGMAKEAMEAAKAMGLEGPEALKCAGYSLKMAKHMASKQAQKPVEAAPVEAAPVVTEAMPPEKEECGKKESAEILKLTGENMKLKESLLKYEIKEHTENVLRESGLPMRVTKAFRERVKESKSKKEIDEKFELFKDAYGVAGGEAKSELNFFVQPEKTEVMESNRRINLSDCLK